MGSEMCIRDRRKLRRPLTISPYSLFQSNPEPFYPLINKSFRVYRKTADAQYLLFVGTILVCIAFLITCLVRSSALICSACFAFVAFALLVSGASIYTYALYQYRAWAAGVYVFIYGNALWMTWAAVGCTLFSIPALASGISASRKQRYSEPH